MRKATRAEAWPAALGLAVLLLTACERTHAPSPGPAPAINLLDPTANDTGPPAPIVADTNAPDTADALGFTGRLAHEYPVAYRRYLAELPASLASLRWLRHLDEDVATPVESVTVGGRPTLKGSACVPHNCGANSLDLLFDPDQSHIVGMVRLGLDGTARLITIGRPSAAEMACLRRPAVEPTLGSSCPQVYQ
jgi:hypothetical protein